MLNLMASDCSMGFRTFVEENQLFSSPVVYSGCAKLKIYGLLKLF